MYVSPGRVPEARSAELLTRKAHTESPQQTNGMQPAPAEQSDSNFYKERVLDALCIGIW